MIFARKDYETLYHIGRDLWLLHGASAHLRRQGRRIMDMCERVIGRQADRPPRSRL